MKGKGSVLDLFVWIVIAFIVAISVLIALVLSDQLSAPLKGMLSSDKPNPDVMSPQEVMSASGLVTTIFDNIVLIMVVGIGFGAVILAYIVKSSVVLLLFSVLILAILLVVSPIMSNAFRSFAQSPAFSGYIDTTVPMTKLIMANLPIFGLVFGALIIIVVYGKTRSGGE